MEALVNLRSSLLKRPYGDQGLLIKKSLFNEIGGFKSIHIMEDLDFIIRLSEKHQIAAIGCPIYTNSRKWKGKSMLTQALKNLILKLLWRYGESPKNLSKEYYEYL